ncbi:MAG: hypothetical protein KDB03_04680 [Planctomycetales bacterium]|nr:hypothetical protein [Planctomycetales bacterium]
MLFAEVRLPDIPFPQVMLGLFAIVGIGLVLHLLFVLATRKTQPAIRRKNIAIRGLYVLFLIVVATLAVTSFGSILKVGHMSGWALIGHTVVAGAFVFLLLAMSAYLPRGGNCEETSDRWWLARWSAWSLMLSSLVAAAVMFSAMLPILDTSRLQLAMEIHRYAGLLVVTTAVVHAYSLLCTRCGWR